MALLERVENGAEAALDKLNPPEPKEVEPAVKKRLERGRARLGQLTAVRRQAIEFARNNHFVSIAEGGLKLDAQSTVSISDGGTKPDHRVRRSHDLIGPIVKRKVSLATSKVPGYEIVPSTPDPEDYGASKIAENVAVAGYELWHLKRAFKKLVWNAFVSEEGFITAQWDSQVGPFVDISHIEQGREEREAKEEQAKAAEEAAAAGVPGEPTGAEGTPPAEGAKPAEGAPPEAEPPATPEEPPPVVEPRKPEYVGMGEVDIAVFGGLEVMWEPGVDFEKSRWYAIESARPVGAVEDEEGFMGIDLKADADTDFAGSPQPKERGSHMVMVTEYLERPCPKYSKGRKMVYANGKQIFPEEAYPLTDQKGEVVDAPALHRLAYAVDGASDRDRGLVPSLVDAMRSYDLSKNKVAEWIQIALVAQMMAAEGSIITPLTDEPALIVEYDPNLAAGQQPRWREVPPIPPELFVEQDRSKAELQEIAFDQTLENPNSARELTAIYEKEQLAWADFVSDLAEVHARLMRDCLTLVQRHYTEDRMLSYRGRTGWENIMDFRGADLRNQTDVRVQAGSLEPRTRASIEAKIAKINEMFPGYFPPPVVIAALNSAQPEKLIESYEEDEARAHRVISMIKAGTFWNMPERPVVPGEEAPAIDPETGEVMLEESGSEEVTMPNPITGEALPTGETKPTFQPVMLKMLPGWMPRPFDNVDVHRAVFESWMKTDDYERLDAEGQKAAMTYYQALQDLETKAAHRKAELQNQMAEKRGMENAAKPGAKGIPSGPSMEEPPPGEEPPPVEGVEPGP